jgi:hypothetical protein
MGTLLTGENQVGVFFRLIPMLYVTQLWVAKAREEPRIQVKDNIVLVPAFFLWSSIIIKAIFSFFIVK